MIQPPTTVDPTEMRASPSDGAGRPPIHVCLVSGEFPPDQGGVADYTRCLATALADRAIRVTVITSRDSDMPDRSAHRSTPGITVLRPLDHWGWKTPTALHRAVDLLHPDIVHVQYQTAAYGMHPAINLAPGLLRAMTGARTAVTYHDLRVPYLFPKAGPLRGFVTRLPARWADLTITTNALDHEELAAWGRAWHLALVPIGSNIPDEPPDDFDRRSFRAHHGYAADTTVLAYFGFLNASKGGRVLLSALDTLRSQDRDARLVMIGGRVGASDPTNRTYLAHFEDEAVARGLSGAIQWTGHIPAAMVSAWLHAADVVTLPYADGASFRRGSLMAALVHGRPIVTTHVPGGPTDRVSGEGLPDLVDGTSALLVSPDDAGALATAVARIADGPTLAARLATGAARIAQRFTWPAIAEDHEALYRTLLDDHDPAR